MGIVHKDDLNSIELPGRSMVWLTAAGGMPTEKMSVCIIRIPPGETTRPAHSHPREEEFIYIMKGSGRVMINATVSPVREGTAVAFPAQAVHMLQNTGDLEMEVICVFAPPADQNDYKLHEDIDFPA